ncbi:MAG TPA: GNAT family N-acetyltransferase [Rudaea sp.]|nr:GNAT family N-acetyltransferase [Rudaea sp.]
MNDAALANPQSRIPNAGLIRVRRACESDAATLCAAERETARVQGRLVSRPDELHESAFVEKIRELAAPGSYLVAERDGAIVGHALLDFAGRLSALAHVRVLTVVVHPGFTGQGIGTTLVKALQDWARATVHVKRVELRVRETNTVAMHVYKKCGFGEESRFRDRICLPDGRLIDDIGMIWFPLRTKELQA